MHGVGTKEEFEKTLINKYLEDHDSIKLNSFNDVMDILKDVWEQRNYFPMNVAIVFLYSLFYTRIWLF